MVISDPGPAKIATVLRDPMNILCEDRTRRDSNHSWLHVIMEDNNNDEILKDDGTWNCST